MTLKNYTYRDGKIIHAIDLKVSQNKKLGLATIIVGTYHFSIDQIANNDFTQDSNCCLDCPLSFNQNNEEGAENKKTGGCYTQKGLQGLGIKSKIKSLHRKLDAIKDFDLEKFEEFINFTKDVEVKLVRFGVYGEPVLMNISVVESLAKLGKNTTGYTHQWNKPEYKDYSAFFMASTHDDEGTTKAQKNQWRTFSVSNDAIDSILCPASKQAGAKTTCAACGLCDGFNTKKNIYIPKH